jgi:hypothetical protein
MMWALRVTAVAMLAVVLTERPAAAQGPACRAELVGGSFVDASTDLARVADLHASRSGRSFLIRRMSDRHVIDACASPAGVQRLARLLDVGSVPERGVAPIPLELRTTYNSAYPRDWNDGAVWSGRGFSLTAVIGAVTRRGKLEAALAPVITAEENAPFRYLAYPDPEWSRYIHRWHGRFIDLPQRFGDSGRTGIHLGQTYARLNAGGFRGGVSTENIAWGPSRRNPLMLSGTSAGFPHLFVETARPHDIAIGDGEVQVIWGRLAESEWFDFDPDNDTRMLGGFIATLRPRGIGGLYVGAGHLHMHAWNGGTSLSELVASPFTGTSLDDAGLPRDLRLFGLFMRWAAAPTGFEVYGEWMRQDEWRNWVRLLNLLDAAQAYTIGVQQVARRGATAVRLTAEFSHLSDATAHTDVGRGLRTFYVSPHVPQGHTHRGQLLGAPIGPGSEAQFIGVDVFWHPGRTSLSIERARYDDDAYYATWGQHHGPHGHDTELSVRAGQLASILNVTLELEVGWSLRYSRSFLDLGHANFPDYPYLRENNMAVRLGGRWQPPVRSSSR